MCVTTADLCSFQNPVNSPSQYEFSEQNAILDKREHSNITLYLLLFPVECFLNYQF